MKLMGAILIIAAAMLLSCMSLYEEKNRISTIRELCNAVDILCGELSTKQSPVYDLAMCALKHTEGAVKMFFEEISSAFAELGTKSFCDIWSEAAHKQLCRIDGECFSELLHLGNILGKYDLEEQMNALRAFKMKLMKTLNRSEEEYPVRKRLSLGLPAYVSALLIIVML